MPTGTMVWFDRRTGGRFPLALGVLQVLARHRHGHAVGGRARRRAADPGILRSAPASGRLVDGRVARRGFGVLGPSEALCGMAAVVATMVAAGWRPGLVFPGGATLLAASGAPSRPW